MAIDPRYTPLGGTSRRYLDTYTGETVSRHTAEIKGRLRELGWDNAHQRAEFRSTVEYKRMERYGKDVGMDKEAFEKLYARALQEGRSLYNQDRISKGLAPDKRLRFDKNPNGLFAKLLVALGVRDPNESFPPGETPPKKR